MKTFDLFTKPEFRNGDRVMISPYKMGMSRSPENEIPIEGTIIGKSIVGILDFWIVDMRNINCFKEYPYQAICIPHVAIFETSTGKE